MTYSRFDTDGEAELSGTARINVYVWDMSEDQIEKLMDDIAGIAVAKHPEQVILTAEPFELPTDGDAIFEAIKPNAAMILIPTSPDEEDD